MKLARRQNQLAKKGVITTALLLCSCYGVFRYTRNAIAQAPLTIVHDPAIAESYQDELTQSFTNAVHTHGPAYAVADPAHYSPIIAELQIRYTYPYRGIVTYTMVEPCAELNHMVVALKSGALIPADAFNAESRSLLPKVSVPQPLLNESKIPSTVSSFLHSIAPQSTHRFACEWHTADACYYRDTEHAQYTLLADGRRPLSEDDIKVYDAVLHQFKPERSAKGWMVDIRFNGQVVISPDGGL